MRIISGCPGQNTAYLKDFNTNIVTCQECGHEIEFFADERKVKCPQCKRSVFRIDSQIIEYRGGKLIYHDPGGSCLDWCGGCLDKKDYQDIMENQKKIEKKKEDFKKLIGSIDKKDKEVIEFFIEAFQKSINSPKLIDQKIFDILQRLNPGLFIKSRNYYLNFLNL
jgi:hypothetical protein